MNLRRGSSLQVVIVNVLPGPDRPRRKSDHMAVLVNGLASVDGAERNLVTRRDGLANLQLYTFLVVTDPRKDGSGNKIRFGHSHLILVEKMECYLVK
jgi:hypothetical protein